MSTKYSVERNPRWDWERQSDDRPHISDHALDRYDERTPADAPSPETAWEKGLDVEYLRMGAFADSGGRAPERVRVYGEMRHETPWTVLFLVRDDNVVTVYRAEWIDESPVRSYLNALVHQGGECYD